MAKYILSILKIAVILLISLSYLSFSYAAPRCSDALSLKNNSEELSEINNQWRETVGQRVKSLIDEDATVTTKALAEQLEIPARTLYAVGSGRLAPTVMEAEKLADHFDVETSWILSAGFMKKNSTFLNSLTIMEQWWFSSLHRAFEAYGSNKKSK